MKAYKDKCLIRQQGRIPVCPLMKNPTNWIIFHTKALRRLSFFFASGMFGMPLCEFKVYLEYSCVN